MQKMKAMTLKQKKYTYFDFISVVFRIAPIESSLIIILSLVSALLPSVTIFVTSGFVDTAVSIFNGTSEYGEILVPLISLLAIETYGHLKSSIQSFISISRNNKLEKVLPRAFLEKNAKLKYSHIENNDTYDLIAKANEDIIGRFSSRFNDILDITSTIISVVSIVIILGSFVWWTALVAVMLAVPVGILSVRNGKNSYSVWEKNKKLGRYADCMNGILTQRDYLEERSTFKYFPFAAKKWKEYRTKELANDLEVQKINGKRSMIMSLLSELSRLAIYASLIPALFDGLSVGNFIALMTASASFMSLTSYTISWIAYRGTAVKENSKNISDFSQLEEQDGALDEPEEIPDFVFRSIEFKDVSFKYPGTERYILKNCSFELHSNRHYAFVGVNGSGKTTITKLLIGMYDNYEGEILINGKELKKYKLAELKYIYSIVYQDFAKYALKLSDAVKIGDVTKDDDEAMKNAVENIELISAVSNLADGYDSSLGKIEESGVELSGGEWQRIAIARALYKDAPISILDEPTASLDPVAESNIYGIFRKISEGKSVIFITHRLGAARIADEILVVDNGKIAEKGSHNELVEQGGMYASMFKAQKGWYE